MWRLKALQDLNKECCLQHAPLQVVGRVPGGTFPKPSGDALSPPGTPQGHCLALTPLFCAQSQGAALLRPILHLPFCSYQWHLMTKILPSANKISWTSLGMSHLNFPTEQGFTVTKPFLRGSPFLDREHRDAAPIPVSKKRTPEIHSKERNEGAWRFGDQKGCPEGENWTWQLRDRRFEGTS